MKLVPILASVCLFSVGVTVIVAASSSIDCFNRNEEYPQDIKPLHIAVLIIGIMQVLIAMLLTYQYFQGGEAPRIDAKFDGLMNSVQQ